MPTRAQAPAVPRLTYLRIKYWPGAVGRFKPLLASDPEYTRRDAVYFYLGNALELGKNPAEAPRCF